MDGQEVLINLLPDAGNWRLEGLTFAGETGSLTIELRAKRQSCACPTCQQVSEHVHSWYTRTVVDLPLAEWAVKLRLHVRRFRCRNAQCEQQVFTERMPQVVAPSSRRTQRVAKRQQVMTLLVSSSMSERLGRLLGLAAGKDTLLRLVRQMQPVPTATVRVLGVDDWAKRRGHSYGTLLVNLETHEVVDVLPDREAQTLADWLRAHPGVEIISRDRAGAYAEGATAGAPQAQQVADRWHLLNNLSEALVKVLEVHANALRKLPSDASAPVSVQPAPAPAEVEPVSSAKPSQADQRQQQRRQQHRERFELVRDLHQRGMSLSAIAQEVGLDRKTVRKFIQAPAFLEYQPRRRVRSGSKLDPYKPYLVQRWNEGCCNSRQLWRELVDYGYTGGLTSVAQFLADYRRQHGLPARTRQFDAQGVPLPSTPQTPLTPRRAAWLVLTSTDKPDDTDRSRLDRSAQLHPDLQTAVDLAQDFAVMLRKRLAQRLDAWLDSAANSALPAFHGFVAGLRRDYSAVKAGLSLPWSQGQTEGQVNRLKFLKRQSFGRANFDLLRLRVLFEG